jgi:hypothetical protein
MKTKLASAFTLSLSNGLRLTALAATLTLVTASVSAKDNTSTDRATQQLALTGSVPVTAAGPYVQIGTYQVQVSAKLGRAGTVLSDGTWFYPNFTVNDSDAAGTLVVRFNQGRVSEISLVTPTVALAMSAPKKAGDKILVATSK